MGNVCSRCWDDRWAEYQRRYYARIDVGEFGIGVAGIAARKLAMSFRVQTPRFVGSGPCGVDLVLMETATTRQNSASITHFNQSKKPHHAM